MKINARHASIVLIGLLILIILGSICYKCVIWENMVGSNINENLQEGNKKSYLNKELEIKEEPFESYSNPNVPLEKVNYIFLVEIHLLLNVALLIVMLVMVVVVLV